MAFRAVGREISKAPAADDVEMMGCFFRNWCRRRVVKERSRGVARSFAALDLGGEDGFLPDVGIEEECRIRQHHRDPVQATDRGGSLVQKRA
jgi:hypothetical protein